MCAVSGTNNAPKAYLNILFFDDQFKPELSSSVVVPVGYSPNTKAQIGRMMANAVSVHKSGYAYVYFSNESDEMVYFDNFVLTHELSPIREETHYYPFGLTMSAISSKAIGKLENKRGFNGNEIQNKEFGDGSGLEFYDFNARTYDQQIGRFMQIDPEIERLDQERWNGYHFGFDNPIRYNDPDGKFPIETIWDVGNVLWDVGKAIYHHSKGQHAKAKEAWTDAAWDAGAMLTPYVPAGGSKLVKNAIKAEKAINKGADAKNVNKLADKANDARKPPNPAGSKGKPDHQEKVKELTEKAKAEAKNGEKVVTEKKIHNQDSNRRPDVQIVDENGKTRKVFEAERNPNGSRNRKRETEYKRLGIEQETHKVESKSTQHAAN